MTKRLFYQQSEPGSRIAATAQRLSVKARIMMALFALMLIPQGAWAQGAAGNSYNLWIGGTQVTDANRGNLLAAKPDSVLLTDPTVTGSLSFESDNNTLILNNVELKCEISSELPNLTIRFVGINKVNTDALSGNTSGFNAIQTSKATATLKFEKSGDGLCTLELNGRTNNSAVRGFSSVNYGSGDTQCYLHTDVPTTYGEYRDNYGPADNCYSNFSNIYKVTNVVTISSELRYPLWIATGPFTAKQVTSTTITDGVTAGSVTFTPATGTTSSKLTLNSATLDAKILSGLGDLVVEVSGSNKINSSDSGTIFRSVNKGELTIKKASSDAALELEVFGSDNHPAIQGFHTLSYSNFDLNTSATTPTYGVFNDGSSNIYGLYDPNASVNKAIKQATFAKNYDLWVNGTRVTSANASNIGPRGTDFSFDPTESTLHYRSGGSTSYPILSGLPNLTIKIGSPDNYGDYSKNNISIIKFGAPTGVTIAATSGNLTLSKEDGVTGVQQFDIVAYGSEILIQGFDNVTYSDFVILQDGATYNTTNKQLEYPNPSGSGFVGYGGISATFVTPQDISNYYVADIANKDYTGSALAPAITVMETAASATSLVENTDYTVSYKLSGAVTTPIDANTYNVIIDGKGRYTGSITTKTFTIDPIAVTLSWSGTSFTYDGDSHKPNASATGLIGSDVCNVTVSGEQTNASATAYTATATALDNSNYKLPTDVTKTFVINPVDLSSSTTLSVGTITDQTYSGSEIKPEPSVSIKLGKNTTATTLQAGTDFDYGYANNTNAALWSATPAPTVSIKGKGNFTGTSNVKFTINPATITDVEVGATEFEYAPGDTKTVTVTKVSAGSLVLGTSDYSLSGTQSAIAVGSYQFTVTGTGNFQGSKNVDWKINERPASITFSSGRRYMTFYDANETFLVPNNVTAYIVTAVSGSTVTIQQVSYIPAGTPVLLESTPGTTNTKNTGDTFGSNKLSFAAAAVATNGNQYVLYSDEFVKATGTIPAGKVYLTFTSPVRTLTIERNNSATAIEAVSDEDADDEQWYDMQGRKINKPTKDGLYIKNGKKVVVNNK